MAQAGKILKKVGKGVASIATSGPGQAALKMAFPPIAGGLELANQIHKQVSAPPTAPPTAAPAPAPAAPAPQPQFAPITGLAQQKPANWENQVPGYAPTVPNAQQPLSGEQLVTNVNEGADPSYNLLGFDNPMLDRAVTSAHKIAELNQQKQEIETNPAYAPSIWRKILGGIAGGAAGAMTMNPLVGLNMNSLITRMPARSAQRPLNNQITGEQQNLKNFGDVAGMTNVKAERTAQLNQAKAAGENAVTNAAGEQLKRDQFQYEQEHPEMQSPTEVDTNIVQTPKRAGTAPDRVVGKAPTKAGQVDIQIDDNSGQVFSIDKSTGFSKPILTQEGTPLVLSPENAQAFNSYWNGLPPEQRTPEAVLKFNQAGAVNFSLETSKYNEEQKKQRETSINGDVASLRQMIDSKGLKDDAAKYKAAMEFIDRRAQADPQFAPFADDVRQRVGEIFKNVPKVPKRNLLQESIEKNAGKPSGK